jgi:hypothetical protein
MKIKVTLTREYDTEGDDHAHLFEGVSDFNEYALRYFAQDVEALDYTEAKRQGIVEVSNA